jgi:steroid delta-isomerase-like uncharacterized protein
MFSRSSSILIVIIMLIAFGAVINATADTEANKSLVSRVYEEVLNQQNLDLVDEICAPDYVYHCPPNPDIHGTEGFKHFLATTFIAFPDGQYTVEDMVAEGDKVALRWTATGTHQGEFMGIPPTGNQMTVTAIVIHRIASGKIVEEWANINFLGLMQQMGAIPPDREEYTWGEPLAVTGDPGETEANQEIVRRFAAEVMNQGNLSVADELIAADCLYHFPGNLSINSLESIKQWVSGLRAIFPDIQITIEDLVAEGDKVAKRWTFLGTHTGGEYMGVPPTGNQLSYTGITIYRIADDKAAELWWSYDALGFMQQLTAPNTEANKAIVRRSVEEFWNTGNMAAIDEFYATDDLEQFKQAAMANFTGFPDLHLTIDDLIAEGDKVAKRWTVRGTHTGEFMGIPPTGKQITVTGTDIYRIASGKFVEAWGNLDALGLMQQLGVMPPDRDNYNWGVPSEVTGEPGDPEENKAIVIRYVEEAWNQQNLELLAELLNPDVVDGSLVGIEAQKQFMTAYFTGFPDIHLTVEDLIAEGDKVVHRWLSSGTHQGELMGIPASGNYVTSSGITIYRLADGKIVEFWWAWDALGMMQQITPPEVPTEGYDNVFFLSLQSGLNMVSLPLKPITPYTARSFADEIGATVVIKLDEARQRFIGFTLDAPDDGFAVEGGKGYIVNMPESKVVAFTGAAWTNQPPVEASPFLAPNDGAWAFVVSGRLVDNSDDSFKKDGYLLTIRNTRTNAVATDVVRSVPLGGKVGKKQRTTSSYRVFRRKRATYFAAAFADLNRNNVVQTGDRLEVVVRNRTGEMVSDTLSYTVTADAILKAYLSLTLKNVEIPRHSLLLQNYPNPFNPETWIPYQIHQPAEVVIRIYDANGRLVRTLDLGQRAAGFYLGRSRAAYWDGKNDSSEPVSSGLYFYQLQAGDVNSTRKLVIVK